MVDQNINPKIITPFNFVSSSVTGGMINVVHQHFRNDVDIANAHEDKIGDLEGAPLQSPFTERHVGGHSYRHTPLNTGNDNARNRPEAWHLTFQNSTLKIYSHKFYQSPPSYFTRDETVKRAVNIRNIRSTTSTASLGNFTSNYEIVQIAGRYKNSFLKNILTGAESAGNLRSRFVIATNAELDNTRRSTDEIDGHKNKTVFVSRFNSPGGVNESSRASLDVESEELSPNNPIPFRNHKIRQVLGSLLSQSALQFGNSIHGVNRNTLRTTSGLINKDNFFVQHAIPRTDIQYAWISASTTTKAIDLGGYQKFGNDYNRGENFTDILFNGEVSGSDKVINRYRKEFNINLDSNTLEPLELIDLSTFSSDQTPIGSVGGFSLIGNASIRYDTTTKTPWIVLFGLSPNFGGFNFEREFNNPMVLEIISFGDIDPNLGIKNAPDISETILLEISFDRRQTWSTHSILRNGTDSNPEAISRVELDYKKQYNLRITTNCNLDDEGWAIKSVKVFPLLQYTNNSDYSYSSWKQIRTSENLVAQRLRSANIISIVDVPKEKVVLRDTSRLAISSKRGDSSTAFVEPLVTSKYKPLSHTFVIKGADSISDGNSIVHTYTNNLSSFANKDLISRLSMNEVKEQFYHKLLDFYQNTDRADSPIAKMLSFKIEETIYPKEQNTSLSKTRGRNEYLINKPGFDRDGYDRQLGTQRAFWRDDSNERTRSPSGSINSQNYFIGEVSNKNSYSYIDNNNDNFTGMLTNSSILISNPRKNLGQNSILPIDKSTNTVNILTASFAYSLLRHRNLFSRVNTFNNCGELNSFVWSDTFVAFPEYSANLYSGSFTDQGEYWRSSTVTVGVPVMQRRSDLWPMLIQTPNNSLLHKTFINELSGNYFPRPRLRYTAFLGGIEETSRPKPVSPLTPFEHTPTIQPKGNNCYSTLDSGLRYAMDEMTNKRPWFDSYEKYSDDIRGLTKDYSILPEFRVSENISYYVSQSGGNFRAKNNAFLSIDGIGDNYRSSLTEKGGNNIVFQKTYIDSDLIKNHDQIKADNDTVASLEEIKIKVSGIKKLLPYNGFYPIQRTVQLGGLYSEYIKTKFHGGLSICSASNSISSTRWLEVNTDMANMSYQQAALEPLFSPGILFNTIKAGIAVDWPAITGGLNHRDANPGGFDNYPTMERKFNRAPPLSYRRKLDTRIPFETLIFPELGFIEKTKITSSFLEQSFYPYFPNNETEFEEIFNGTYLMSHFEPSTKFNEDMTQLVGGVEVPINDNKVSAFTSLPFTYIVSKTEINPQYSMAMSNFLAETTRFFLEGEKMVTFSSKQESKWKTFKANKSYYLDIIMKKDPSLVMIEAYSSSYILGGRSKNIASITTTMNGRYFGYPVDKVYNKNGIDGSSLKLYPVGYLGKKDSLYETAHNDPSYAPYTPPYFEGTAICRLEFKPTETKKYNYEEIMSQITYDNIFPELLNHCERESTAYINKMPIESSVEMFGSTKIKEVEFNIERSKGKKVNASLAKDSATSDKTIWTISPKLETPVLDFSNQPFVSHSGSYWQSAGFGRGMWSGYGTIPDGSKGIYLGIKESFPGLRSSHTGSLLDQVGFKAKNNKIGEIAEAKEISEAVVAIPYLDYSIVNVTTNINGKNFIRINKTNFNVQRQNIFNGDAAIKIGNLGSKVEIQETSISNMIEALEDYVIPPQFNFMIYPTIKPFAIYIFEFKHLLDQQDLADIWQGLMPKIAITAELDDIEISHKSGPHEFFHGKELPNNLRWMIFKVKKKAEKNYFATTANAEDDNKFVFDFKVGRKEPEYSYNWPYDYFSLVEFAKVEVAFKYTNKNVEEKLGQNPLDRFRRLTNRQVKKSKPKRNI